MERNLSMIDITAANTARLPTRAKPSDEPKRYRTRRDAEAAELSGHGDQPPAGR